MQDDEGNTSCLTRNLPDTPASEDFFGPHRKIARALFQIITGKGQGRSIGIAGSWGVGKSTVVTLLERELEETDDVHLWSFDAWSHEGDPLRRSFLEALIKDLSKSGLRWLDPETWAPKVERLRRKLRHEHTKSTPRVASGGYIIALALLLVPLGAILMEQAVSRGLTFGWTGAPSGLAWLGGLLIFAPAWMPGLAWLLMLPLRPRIRNWKPAQDTESKAKKLHSFLSTLEQDLTDLRKVYNPLRGVQEVDVFTDAFEEGQPSSIEFAELFTEVLDEALGPHKERRLVMVLDNLDRLPSDQAKAIWATLQPFMQSRPWHNWSHRLWVLVSYDPQAIRTLGGDGAAESATEGPFGSHTSYVDKTIRIEFRVPRPVLSDWRRYLREQLQEALPQHNKADFPGIERLVGTQFPHIHDAPTPRQVKKLVNAIGAMHRLWGHEIPLIDMAYYALQLRLSRGVKISLPIPPGQRELLSRSAEDNLYCLHFGVELARARQLRLGDDLLRALLAEDTNRLKKILDDTPAAWSALEQLVIHALQDWRKDQRLPLAVSTLLKLDHPKAKEFAGEIAGGLDPEFVISDPGSNTDEALLAVISLLDPSQPRRQKIAQRYATIRSEALFEEDPSSDRKPSPEEIDQVAAVVADPRWVEGARIPIPNPESLKKIRINDGVPVASRNHPFWSHLDLPEASLDDTEWLVSQFPSEGLGLSVRAIAMSAHGDLKWDQFIATCRATLRQPVSNDLAVRAATRCLLELSCVEAAATLVGLKIEAPHLLRSLEWALSEQDTSLIAEATLLSVEWWPESNSDAAPADVWKTTPADVQEEVGRFLLTISRELGRENQFLPILIETSFVPEAVQKAYVASVINEKTRYSLVIPAELVVEQAGKLNRLKALRSVIEHLTQDEIDDVVSEATRASFKLDRTPLYLMLLERTDAEGFLDHLAASTKEMSSDLWKRVGSKFTLSKRMAQFVERLRERGRFSEVSETELGGVMIQQVREQLTSYNRTRPYLLRRLESFFPLLSDTEWADLQEEVYTAARDRKLTTKAWFFNQYGDLLAESSDLRRPGPRIVDEIYLPIIERRSAPLAGLTWLENAISNDPQLIETKGKPHRRRLRRAVKQRLSSDVSKFEKEPLERLLGLIDQTL